MSKQRTRSPFFLVYLLVLCASLVVGYYYTKATWPDNEVARVWNTFTPAHAQGQTLTVHLSVSPGSSSVVGRPTLAPDFLNRVLAAAHSPAQGMGQVIYTLSLKYSIDDAYALAFFQHESVFGTTGEARKTLSPGNERCIQDRPCIDLNRGGYAQMDSWADGFEHWYMLIANLYIKQWGRVTVEQIIPKYAPHSDGNDEQAYIQAVEQSVRAWRKGGVQI